MYMYIRTYVSVCVFFYVYVYVRARSVPKISDENLDLRGKSVTNRNLVNGWKRHKVKVGDILTILLSWLECPNNIPNLLNYIPYEIYHLRYLHI